MKENGHSLIELLITIALAAILIPALLTGFTLSRSGRAQQEQRLQATAYLKEAQEATRVIQANGWNSFINGTYHPEVSGNTWILAPGAETVNGDLIRQVVVSDVLRDPLGNIVSGGGVLDFSTKKVEVSVSWTQPLSTSVNSTMYISRYKNNAYTETTAAHFNSGTLTNTQVTNVSGGEIKLSNNNKAKWCSPAMSSSTIDLPDGPPVAVAATASGIVTIPNDVYVATSPTAANSVKLAYLNVTADTDPPVTTLRGKFTMDPAQYSNPSYVPSGTGLDNNFKTNDVKFYTSAGGKTYALLATDLPSKEVIAIIVNDGNPANDETTTGEFQDPVNNIYKYHTFFNTRRYSGVTSNDYAPYAYGANSLTVFGDRGYATSGGYLYVFNLSNIDTKSTGNGLDMNGCRLELAGKDCNLATSRIKKYGSGDSDANFDSEQNWLSGCSDGGNVEIYADNDIFPVKVGNNTYIYVAVGGAADNEFEIINVTTPPTSGNSLTGSSCGRVSSNNSSWRRTSGTLDFNDALSTQEASNSVFAKSDGTRAYISSNGGIDADHNGQPDSKQFYVINTTNKNSPVFLSTSGSPEYQATSGYYYGSSPNDQLFPKRSLTVLNGERVVLVGRDGISDGNNAQEYQVLNSANEASPAYCAGLDFDQGFNDLTSVSEADFDNFVYMVANTTVNELKIVEGGSDDAIFVPSGTFESQVFDAGADVMGNRFNATSDVPAQTTLTYQVAIAPANGGSCSGVTYTFVGPDGTSGTFFTSASELPRSSDGSGYENGGRCIKYKVYMTSVAQQQTPTLFDFGINYSP